MRRIAPRVGENRLAQQLISGHNGLAALTVSSPLFLEHGPFGPHLQFIQPELVLVGKTSGIMSAFSGSTVGTGDVIVYELPSTTWAITDPARTITAYNLANYQIGDNTNVLLIWHQTSGNWLAIPMAC